MSDLNASNDASDQTGQQGDNAGTQNITDAANADAQAGAGANLEEGTSDTTGHGLGIGTVVQFLDGRQNEEGIRIAGLVADSTTDPDDNTEYVDVVIGQVVRVRADEVEKR